MARKFFNQKVPNSKKTVTQIVVICACVIGIIVCFCLVSHFNNKASDDAIIEIRDTVTIEVNGDLPDKTVFFTKLENVPEDDIEISYADANVTKIGEYPVTIKLYNKKYNVNLVVVDTISPELVLKDVTIEKGESYTINDFVESCSDNDNNECNIEFYDLAIDQNGNAIDYSKYTNDGTYKIQIEATDASDNTTLKDATLIIGNENGAVTACQFGDEVYNTEHILAINVTDNGCAIDLNLYKDETTIAPVETIMQNETEKLKKEFQKLNIEGNISLSRNAVAIRNTADTGIVGYSIHMELIVEKDGTNEIVESYYLDQYGKRTYSVNKYNLE